MSGVRNALLVCIGLLCIALGTVGIVLPLLPTTPFYLLATLCFAKGSKRFHRWFTNTRLYKTHLESYVETRSMTLGTKLKILIPVTVMLFLAGFFVDILAMRIVIGILLTLKWCYFIFVIKTIRQVGNRCPHSS